MDDQLMDWLQENVARMLVAAAQDEIMSATANSGGGNSSNDLSIDKLPLMSACREAMHSYYCARIVAGLNDRLYGVAAPTGKQVDEAYAEVVQQLAAEGRDILTDAMETLADITKNARERYNARWN